jgi:hypothetical protein
VAPLRQRFVVALVLLMGSGLVAWGAFQRWWETSTDLEYSDQSSDEPPLNVIGRPDAVVTFVENPGPAGVPEPSVKVPLDTQDRKSDLDAARAAYSGAEGAPPAPLTPTLLNASPIVVFDATDVEDLPRDLGRLLPSSTLLASRVSLPDEGPTLFVYRAAGHPEDARPLDVVSVFNDTAWLGVFLSEFSPDCQWLEIDELWSVTDDFGVHPMLGSVAGGAWQSTAFADFVGRSGPRSFDWRAIPARGDGFDRQWKAQLHISSPPATDGIVFRYEDGLRYLSRTQGGRGNSAHHWNLLAYDISVVDVEALNLREGNCTQRLVQGIFPEGWLQRYF